MPMLDEVIKQIGACFQSPPEKIWLRCVCDDCAGYGKREYTTDAIHYVTQDCRKCNGTGEMSYRSDTGSDVTLTGSHDHA